MKNDSDHTPFVNTLKNAKNVSVIIPTYNSGRTLEACLTSIKKQTYKHLEIIVVDNNSTDKTKEIASDFTKHVLNFGPERSAQRNFGAKNASGDYFLFIDSDMVLTRNVVTECVTQIMETNAQMIVIPELSFGQGFWAKCKSLERSFYVGIEWMEAARFFDRKTFFKFGGYDENNTGTEDYDLPQRILADQKYAASQTHINSYIHHDEGQLSLKKTLLKKFYYGKNVKIYQKSQSNAPYFKKQSGIFGRYSLFFSMPEKLFRDPIIGVGMLTMKTLEFIFGGVGYLLSKSHQ